MKLSNDYLDSCDMYYQRRQRSQKSSLKSIVWITIICATFAFISILAKLAAPKVIHLLSALL